MITNCVLQCTLKVKKKRNNIDMPRELCMGGRGGDRVYEDIMQCNIPVAYQYDH